MKTLILLRHAKSDWSAAGQPDLERPLAARGRRAAPVAATHIDETVGALDHVWLSPSVRTRETWSRMIALLTAPPEPQLAEALYTEDPAPVLEVAAGTPESARRCLIVGHNPALEQAAALLCGEKAWGRREFPTAAAAIFTFAGAWAELTPGSMRLISFETPKSLV